MLKTFKKIHWTEHSKAKMRQYGLSKIKLIQMIRKPERVEKGIAEGTTAVMMTNKSFSKTAVKNKRPAGETWLMYVDDKNFRKVISAWRYPGISKPGDAVPVPDDIRQALENNFHEFN